MLVIENDVSNEEIVLHKPTNRMRRIYASFIDGLSMSIPLSIALVVGAIIDSSGKLMFILAGLVIIVFILYQAYLLAKYGQSIGKKLMKIKIVRYRDGENGGFLTNVLIRSLGNTIFASVIPFYALVDLAFIYSKDNRCLHDRIAGTVVVEI